MVAISGGNGTLVEHLLCTQTYTRKALFCSWASFSKPTAPGADLWWFPFLSQQCSLCTKNPRVLLNDARIKWTSKQKRGNKSQLEHSDGYAAATTLWRASFLNTHWNLTRCRRLNTPKCKPEQGDSQRIHLQNWLKKSSRLAQNVLEKYTRHCKKHTHTLNKRNEECSHEGAEADEALQLNGSTGFPRHEKRSPPPSLQHSDNHKCTNERIVKRD